MERPRPSRPSRGGGARSAGLARGSAPDGVSAPLRGGNYQPVQRIDTVKMADQFGTCTNEKNSHPSKSRRHKPLKEASATLMKSLIAEELSHDMGRRQSPGVIAKLMGLEPLSIQQQTLRVKKRLSETSYPKATCEFQQNNYSSRKHIMHRNNPQQFKDIYEVLQTSKTEKRMLMSVKKDANSKFNMEREAYVRQKFIDAKRLSCDHRCHSSKDFHDALEVLESNKDLFLKILQEPNSLFAKHPHELQSSSPPVPERVLKSAKSSRSKKYGADYNKDVKTKVEILLGKHDICPPHKFLKSLHEEAIATDLPTRIVVLKPHLRVAQISGEVVRLPNSLSNSFITCRSKEDTQKFDKSDRFCEANGRSNATQSIEETTQRQKSPREIAREITLEMRRSADSSRNLALGNEGLSICEKPCTSASSEILNDRKVLKFASNRYRTHDAMCNPSSSRSKESYVNREAKRRLSERWKMSHRSQEAKVNIGAGTLGEMLAWDGTKSINMPLDSMFVQAGSRDRLLGTPLGISSKDGWKGECPPILTKSRSLPASSTAHNYLNTESRYEALSDDEGSAMRKMAHLSLEKQENFCLKSGHAILRRMELVSTSNDCNVVDNIECEHPSQKSLMASNGRRDVHETTISSQEQQIYSKTYLHETESQLGIRANTSEHELKCLSEESQIEHSTTLVEKTNGDTITHVLNDLPSQDHNQSLWESHSAAGVSEIQSTSKDSKQPSPTSVLETLSDEDISNTDCFEKVSAGLHELRLQLELLKTDTGISSLTIVSDEEADEECASPIVAKEPVVLNEEKRDFSFILDALLTSGIDASLTLHATRYSSEFPLNPVVFEKLDQKYKGWQSWTRGERRLLFDQMNSVLSDILDACMDDRPYVKSKAYRIVPMSWSTEALAEMIWKLLSSQGIEEGQSWGGKALKWNLVWTEFSGDVDKIGQELQGFLMKDLVEEVLQELASGIN